MNGRHRRLSLSIALASLWFAAKAAGADDQPPAPVPRPQPLIETDDLRNDAPATRYVLEPWGSYGQIRGPASGTVGLYTWQVGLGPASLPATPDQAASALSALSARVRGTGIDAPTGKWAGPMTFSLQQFLQIDPFSALPLLDVHGGIEVALATPWLSDRKAEPPPALQAMNAVDTELAGNGWSLRPVGANLRADLMICRNISLDVGASPEVFVPTEPGRRTEVDLRWHAGAGLGFACKHRADSGLHHLTAGLEVRGLGRLYSADAAPAHHTNASLALQYDWHLFTLGAFMILDTVDPTSAWSSDYKTFGIRLQIGLDARTDG